MHAFLPKWARGGRYHHSGWSSSQSTGGNPVFYVKIEPCPDSPSLTAATAKKSLEGPSRRSCLAAAAAVRPVVRTSSTKTMARPRKFPSNRPLEPLDRSWTRLSGACFRCEREADTCGGHRRMINGHAIGHCRHRLTHLASNRA